MWLLGLVIMIDQVDQNIVRGLVTPLKEDPRLHMTDLKIGMLLSSFVLVNAVITVPAGYLADRWHRVNTVGHTIIGWSGITAMSAAFPNFFWLLGVRSALGFGQAITEPSCASLLGDYYEPDRRGKAFSIQQCLLLAGVGLGVALGGGIGATLGWRWAFVIVGVPGVFLAFAVYRLREPRRGEADRRSMGHEDDDSVPEERPPLIPNGFGQFVKDLIVGLRKDAKTIWSITTMRYALVGVSALLFTITAIAAGLPQFYERHLGLKEGIGEAAFGGLAFFGGIPGVLVGGVFADRFQNRVRGARMAIPAYCLLAGNALFFVSLLRLPFAAAYPVQIVSFFVIAMAIPALRAGLTDAVPHNLRGAGFGFFNLASVVFGSAAAPLITFALADVFDENLRTAFMIVTPPVFLGALLLLKARDHLDEDTQKIFMAIATAVQEEQARQEAAAAEGVDS